MIFNFNLSPALGFRTDSELKGKYIRNLICCKLDELSVYTGLIIVNNILSLSSRELTVY